MSKEFNLALTGDFHITNGKATQLSHVMLERVIESIGSQNPDALLLVGDMTDSGSIPATEVVARILGRLPRERIPVIAVLGNHDHRTGNVYRKKRIYKENGVIILDGERFGLRKRGGDGGSETHLGILGVTGGYDGSLYTGEKVYPLPSMIGCDLNASLAALTHLLRTTPYPHNIVLTHFNAGFPTMSYTRNRYAMTSGSIRTEALVRGNKRIVQAVVHGHTHLAHQYGKIDDDVDVICASMQVSLRDARIRNIPTKERVKERDFYTMYKVNG